VKSKRRSVSKAKKKRVVSKKTRTSKGEHEAEEKDAFLEKKRGQKMQGRSFDLPARKKKKKKKQSKSRTPSNQKMKSVKRKDRA